VFTLPQPSRIHKSAAEIARALGGRRCGSGWIAKCPSHEDRNPSLSITEADGKVLVHCHSGCSQRQLVQGLRALDLWPERRREWLPREEYLRRLRARREAERRAKELSRWRREQVELLVRMKNLLFDRRRAAETWLETTGRRLGFDDPRVIRALEIVSDHRPELFERALEQLERLWPSELEQLRRRLERREAAA